MILGKKKVSARLIDKFREYFEDVPDRMTADDAVEYALYCRALEGEGQAYKELKHTGEIQNVSAVKNKEFITSKIKDIHKSANV